MNKLNPALAKACSEITQNLLTINQPVKNKSKKKSSKSVQNMHLRGFLETMRFYQQ